MVALTFEIDGIKILIRETGQISGESKAVEYRFGFGSLLKCDLWLFSEKKSEMTIKIVESEHRLAEGT